MVGRSEGLIGRIAHRRALARWTRVADAAADLELDEIRRQRGRASALRRLLERVIDQADRRLAVSVLPPAPLGADWIWRPQPWAAPLARSGVVVPATGSEICPGVTLHHDAPGAALTLRQIAARGAADPAPFALALDCLDFPGSFLSLALALPEAAQRGLRSRHLLRVTADLAMERPVEVFARLNLRHGPNHEQLVQQLRPGRIEVEFDLSGTRMNERRVEAMWLDLIFESPAMNRFVLADLVLCRRPRAEL